MPKGFIIVFTFNDISSHLLSGYNNSYEGFFLHECCNKQNNLASLKDREGPAATIFKRERVRVREKNQCRENEESNTWRSLDDHRDDSAGVRVSVGANFELDRFNFKFTRTQVCHSSTIIMELRISQKVQTSNLICLARKCSNPLAQIWSNRTTNSPFITT